MGFDKVKIKQICWMVLYVAVIILLLIYSDVLFKGLKLVVSIFLPFLIGGAIAFILNIPMNSIEKKLFKKWNGKLADKLKRPISMILSIVFVVAIITLVIVAVVPQMRTTITTLGTKITPFLQNVLVWLKGLTTDYPELAAQIQELEKLEFNWESILSNVGGFLKNGVSNVVGSTFTVASSIVGGIANVFIAFVFSIYVLSQKEKLQDQVCRILDAYTPAKVNRNIREVFHRLYVNFSNFICGQCLEAVILGSLFVIFMTIFRMPYAIMIGTLIAFTSLIPIVGAFIGCGVGAFMILIDNPIQALWFVIMFLIIQQLEGNLIYPRVVGNSVGLPSIWVLMSVSVGGSLFGVVGMLMFIPLMSTLYSLLRDDVNRRNAGKGHGKGHGNRSHEQHKREKKQQKNPPKTEVAEEISPAQIVERLVAEQQAKVQQELAEQGLTEPKPEKNAEQRKAEVQKPERKKPEQRKSDSQKSDQKSTVQKNNESKVQEQQTSEHHTSESSNSEQSGETGETTEHKPYKKKNNYYRRKKYNKPQN
ncbi:MAG: AI-2E family transporter [Lachnospiraceae bacterium]|nr:AI-2E family transporter [Lachnospiraceae bacterium]